MGWHEMSRRQRGAVLTMASIEFALTTAAAVDLWYRPQQDVHGRKGLWWLGIFVQPFGAIAYLAFGRRRAS